MNDFESHSIINIKQEQKQYDQNKPKRGVGLGLGPKPMFSSQLRLNKMVRDVSSKEVKSYLIVTLKLYER